MIKILQGIFLFSLVFLVACMPQSPRTTRKLASSPLFGTPTPTPTSSTSDDNVSSRDYYWYAGGEIIENALNINANTEDNVYLRGERIHDYLNLSGNVSKSYCVVLTFSSAALAIKQFRARAVAISTYHTATQTRERLFKIDFSNPDNINSTSCPGILNGETMGATATGTLSDLCPTCTGTYITDTVKIYSYDTSYTELDDSLVNLSTLTTRVDMSSNFDNNQGSCTNSSCIGQGYDCCFEGSQCVNNGQEKQNASTHTDYAQATADVSLNPNNYIRWPEIYYSCGTIPSGTPTPTPIPDIQATVDARLENLKKQYDCITGGLESTPDYSLCEPSADLASFTQVRADVWEHCGCAGDLDPAPSFPPDGCTDYVLEPAVDLSGNIYDYTCTSLRPDATPTPINRVTVNLRGRTSPRRFYDATTGLAVDDHTSLSTAAPEGTPFSYIDDINKTDPEGTQFNMNAITGQMDVTLTYAIPTQALSVELDQVYELHTLQGSFIPCVLCPNDFWLDSFKPYPLSSNGLGVQATGYTTRRNEYVTNTSLGNYEDSIFGRACWVPPTMLPFSHQKMSGVQNQRMARQKTQSALYMNGYQRDWYGFNYGAVIGSFDGEKWFAVGTGRRVLATSTKLFLAINAPFSDLNENTNIKVEVMVDNGTEQSFYDYDPNLEPEDSRHNGAASCQRFHQCETDTDCITRLGWEYRCADTSYFKTYSPRYNSEAVEQDNEELNGVGFATLLQEAMPSYSTKRCVYRGAGSPCFQDPSSLGTEEKKLFTCAPNFHCAAVTSAEFNNELVRTPNQVEIFQFGQEANVLGRPLVYQNASNTLDTDIQSNLQYNAALYPAATGVGICRPGRDAGQTTLQNQHKTESTYSDYISQIGSCDSSDTGSTRVQSCPIIEEDQDDVNYGNYVAETFTAAVDLTTRNQQNACGGETLDSSSTNPFEDIEAGILSALSLIQTEVLTKDACKRRAGSVCHTDFDCTPNQLHADLALFFGNEYFGGTDAEHEYWQEYLVCGQAKRAPSSSALDANYYDYDMSLNRCCREIGQSITMKTQTSSTGSLDVVTFPKDDPTATGRYSRYQVVNPIPADAPASTNPGTPKVIPVAGNYNPIINQWKTFNDTARRTCCGGGWVRKFADDTHDWTQRDRLRFDPRHLQCLNFTNTVPLERPSDVGVIRYGAEYNRLCLSPSADGCMEHSIKESEDGFDIEIPQTVFSANTSSVDTSPTIDNQYALFMGKTGYTDFINEYAPYIPVVYPISNGSTKAHISYENSTTESVSFYIPLYIGYTDDTTHNITQVKLKFFDALNNYNLDTGAGDEITVAAGAFTTCDNITTRAGLVVPPDANTPTVCLDNTNRALHIYAEKRGGTDKMGVEISFNIRQRANDLVGAANTALSPGNDMFYLTKLGRLELLGVPQVFYDQMYCNTDSSTLVDGIYDSAAVPTTLSMNGEDIYDVLTTAGTNPIGNRDQVVFKDDITIPEIFSEDKFACCMELGQVTASAENCCTNFAIDDGDGNLVCKLPAGTDLNVYFNRFISGEASVDFSEDSSGIVLEDTDFNPYTGEPKLLESVYDKLVALGQEFCENGTVRPGGVLGNFNGEPFTGTYLNIPGLDSEDGTDTRYSFANSMTDYEENGLASGSPRGYVPFNQGFRWNHHYYCD